MLVGPGGTHQDAHTIGQHGPCHQKSGSCSLQSLLSENISGNDVGVHFEFARDQIGTGELHGCDKPRMLVVVAMKGVVEAELTPCETTSE
jgi:hypothetical protein